MSDSRAVNSDLSGELALAVALPRTAVLLGAGASHDAGLPLTQELARILVQEANRDAAPVPADVLTLNFVYSAMVGHQGEDGADPLRAVNVETLVSAIRLLGARASHEVAPFVAAWKSGASGIGSEAVSRDIQRKLKTSVKSAALGDAFGGSSFEGDRLAEIIQEISRLPPSLKVFKELELRVITGIRRALSGIGSVSYLEPLGQLAAKQRGGLDVITLNYDLTVEVMAKGMALPLDVGIDRWVPGDPMSFEPTNGQINLIKLHGSLDWVLRNPRDRSWLHQPRLERVDPQNDRVRPWIVVGDREKLATDGPTLSLLAAAQESLRRSERVVVIGYSFADAHVNNMIRDWMNGDEKRTLVVLDPAWRPMEPRSYGRDEEIGILEALRIMAGQPISLGQRRVRVIRGTAGERISDALVALPLSQVTYARILRVCIDANSSYLRVTNYGEDLEQVKVVAHQAHPQAQSVRALSLLPGVGSGHREVLIPMLRTGDSVDIYLLRDTTHDRSGGSIGLLAQSEVNTSISDHINFEWPIAADAAR